MNAKLPRFLLIPFIVTFISSSAAFASEAASPESSGGIFKYSKDSNVLSQQKDVYNTIIRYQNALNSGDTKTILSLFSKESFSQWNNLLTADTNEKRKSQYDDLFSKEKFKTDFSFDTIWINGDTAVVRTHHHVGSVVTNFKEQKTVIDLNREVFVLKKVNGDWKIFLYTFNTNPLQGVS